MRLGTKRYFCGGCGAAVDGPGRFCREGCVAKARASVIDANIRTLSPSYDGREGLSQHVNVHVSIERHTGGLRPDFAAALRQRMDASQGRDARRAELLTTRADIAKAVAAGDENLLKELVEGHLLQQVMETVLPAR